MIRICFHGAESTGKTVLAEKLADELGCPWVSEFGRAYAEQHGIDFAMEDLLAIARGQDEAMRGACVDEPSLVILDTDPLMTAAWAKMLFDEIPAKLFEFEKAEHYLLFEADTPWQEDGTRLFGTDDARSRFATLAEDMLLCVGVPFTRISGDWVQRETQVRAAVARILDQ